MKQDRSHVFHPIRLAATDGFGETIVRSVEDAARELLTEWPDDDGDSYYEAVKACLDCLHQQAAPDAARTAFVRAAQEAGIFVGNQAPTP